MDSENTNSNFIKTLNLFDATAIVAGAMIGSGIFIVPSLMAKDLHSASFVFLSWLFAGIMTIIGALTYGEFAASLPEAGGQYVYIRKVWGEITGFLYGWTLFLVIQTGSIAAVAIAFAKFSGILLPAISTSNYIFKISYISLSTQQLLSITLIVFLSWLNLKGVKLVSRVQNTVTIANVLALFGIITCGLIFGLRADIIHANFVSGFAFPDIEMNLYTAIGAATVGALFAMDGWNNLTFIAAEIKQTEKNLPLALLFGTGLVILLYALTNFVYLAAMPVEHIAQAKDNIIGAAFMQSILGDYGKLIICAVILLASFGCVNSMILAGPRVYYAMAKDRLFFHSLAKLGEKSRVPESSIYLQCFWSVILVMSGTYMELLDYLIFASILFYLLTVGGIFIFRRKYPEISRPYKTLGYPYLPAIYCILGIFIEITLLIINPKYTWSVLIIMLIGIPVYLVWKRTVKLPEVTEAMQETDIVE